MATPGLVCRWLADGSALARTLGDAAGVGRPAASLESPEREIWRALDGPAELDVREAAAPGAGFWSRVVVIESARRSQFDALGDLVASGLALPGAVAAVAGTSPHFHGFHGRAWESALGNLHLSVAIPLEEVGVGHSAALTVVAAVSLVDAIAASTGGSIRPQIKWVTDLYVDGRKVAGILTRTFVAGRRAELVLHGIGVNVAHAPAITPSPFVPAVGAVRGVRLATLFDQLLSALARRYRELLSYGPRPLLTAYRESSCVPGRHVRIYPDVLDGTASDAAWSAPVAVGLVTGIGDDLFLTLEGTDRAVGSGRLAFEEDCLAFGLPSI